MPESQVTDTGKDIQLTHNDDVDQEPPDSLLGNDRKCGLNSGGHQIIHDLISGGEKLKGGFDSSLSSYGILLIQLRDRIKQGRTTDDLAQNEARHKKPGLALRIVLLWKGHLLYVTENIQLRNDLLCWLFIGITFLLGVLAYIYRKLLN